MCRRFQWLLTRGGEREREKEVHETDPTDKKGRHKGATLMIGERASHEEKSQTPRHKSVGIVVRS